MNITQDPRFHQELVNIMKSVHQNRQALNYKAGLPPIEESKIVTQRAIDVATNYFSDMISKSRQNPLRREQANTSIPQTVSGPVRTMGSSGGNGGNMMMDMPVQSSYMPRPVSTNSGRPSTTSNNGNGFMPEYMQQNMNRGIPSNPQPVTFQEPRQYESNEDVRMRYDQLSKNREQDNNISVPGQQGGNGMVAQMGPFTDMSINTRKPPSSEFVNDTSMVYSMPPEVSMNTSSFNNFNNYVQSVQQTINPMPSPLSSLQNSQSATSHSQAQSHPQQMLNTNFQGNYQAIQQEPHNFNNSIMNRAASGDSQYMSGFVPTHMQYSGATMNTSSQYLQQPSVMNNMNMTSDNVNLDELFAPSANADSLEQQFQSKPFEQPSMPTHPQEQTLAALSELGSTPLGLGNNGVNGGDIPMMPDPERDGITHANTDMSLVPSVRENTVDVNIGDSNLVVSNNELAVLQKSIMKNQSQLEETNSRINQLMSIMEKQDITKFYETIMDIPRLITSQQKQPLTLRTHNLIISSKDRDLTNEEFDKYNFRVVFGAESNQTVAGNYKAYQSENGVSEAEKENIRGDTKEYVSSGLLVPTIQQVLRNVVSIKLLRVVIPRPSDDCYVPEPYLFVAVDEFGSNILSTKNFNSKIFCKIHFDKEVAFGAAGSADTRKYLYYKNDDDDFTMFFASPLAKLDRLTLKLLGSDGEPMKEIFNDIDWASGQDYTNNNQQITIPSKNPNAISFSNSLFKGDKCLIYDKNVNGNHTLLSKSRIQTVASTHIHIATAIGINYTDTVKVINLSNQVEYVLEVKTQELDPTANVRPVFE